MFGKNIWLDASDEKKKSINSFANDYIEFLSNAKTERLAVKETLKLIEAKGFKPFSSFKELKQGDKVYFNNHGKNLFIYVIGQKDVKEGIRVLGAHIDSPRMDLKQNPLYEANGFALMDTHYYGGIKKYQWVTIPLALHGVVCKKDGSVIDVNIGEDSKDPVVGISDLLIHLANAQMGKTADHVVEGEALDVTVGSMPLKDTDKDAVKANVLAILKQKYGMEEEDFLSAEIEVVPAGRAREYGLDRSMVLGYGHDDRVCAYSSLRALLDSPAMEYTTCCALVDKEEIGSVGATGAASLAFENSILELLNLQGDASLLTLRKTFEASKMLSSDVSAGFDPLYPEVFESKNAAFLGNGIVFNKYTGARGKSSSNDANAEYVAWVRNAMDANNVHFQTAELGKVDAGGGGTIAYILAKYNMAVIDAGVAVLNMHAPHEVISKADLYEAYLAYMAFLK